MSGFRVCGIAKGLEKQYRCPGCEFESDDLDWFATSMCWTCVFQPGDEEPDEDALIESLPVTSLDTKPCLECGEAGACAYDSEGRPLIHAEVTEDAR